ncbi:MAG: SRPBCC domain-containing protein [SAR202 cluster bacterium]|nr:SRPBCC domain-containing protein [SAR202 cluster bacterium]
MEKIDKAKSQLTVTRIFDAPRELVFETFTTCEHLKNWWGPRTWPTAECAIDFRPGGVWHYCLRGPNGEEAWGKAVYRDIVRPERIVYVDQFSDRDGNTAPGMPESTIDMRFAAQGTKTKFTSVTTYASPSDLQKVLDMGVVAGFNETLDRLVELLARLQKERGPGRKK